MRLGAKIRRPMKIDSATSLVSRGHFTRMCIEVDLSKPLVPKFRLDRRIHRIEYEGLHLIRFGCGKYRHRTKVCLLATHNQAVNTGEVGQDETKKMQVQPNNEQVQEITLTISP